MAEPVKQSTFGGVTYHENQVVKKWKTNEKGAIRYHMILGKEKGKTIEVSYPQQKSTNGASIFVNDSQSSVICHLAYGNVKGSDAKDLIVLAGCNSTVVDVSNDNNSDAIEIFDSHKYKSRNNVVDCTKEDRLIIDTETKASKPNFKKEGKIEFFEATAHPGPSFED